MKSPSLVFDAGMARFADMPVTVISIDRPPTDEAVLLMTPPTPKVDQRTTSAALMSTAPLLIMASETPSDLKTEAPAVLKSVFAEKMAETVSLEVASAGAASYVVSGDVENLFKVPGLSGKLYKFQGDSADDVVKEKVRLKRGKIQDKRLA